MARHQPSPIPTATQTLEAQQTRCVACGGALWVAYHKTRTISTLSEVTGLTLAVRRCQNAACPLYHQAYRPEEEGGWVLPRSTFGLDVIALSSFAEGCRRMGQSRGMGGEYVVDGFLERVGGVVAAHGHVLVFDVAPERLNGVEFGRIRRQIEAGDARRSQGGEDLLDDGTAMHRVVVQHDDAGPAPAVAWGQSVGGCPLSPPDAANDLL